MKYKKEDIEKLVPHGVNSELAQLKKIHFVICKSDLFNSINFAFQLIMGEPALLQFSFRFNYIKPCGLINFRK
jgi:hypothetical protein